MTAQEGRIVRLELMIQRLQTQVATLMGQVAQLETQGRLVPAVTTPGGGGGGGGSAFYCLSVPAIAGGAFGTADVYSLASGSETLFAPAAKIWNRYASASTAGRKCTVCPNGDGTFLLYGQSCT